MYHNLYILHFYFLSKNQKPIILLLVSIFKISISMDKAIIKSFPFKYWSIVSFDLHLLLFFVLFLQGNIRILIEFV